MSLKFEQLNFAERSYLDCESLSHIWTTVWFKTKTSVFIKWLLQNLQGLSQTSFLLSPLCRAHMMQGINSSFWFTSTENQKWLLSSWFFIRDRDAGLHWACGALKLLYRFQTVPAFLPPLSLVFRYLSKPLKQFLPYVDHHTFSFCDSGPASSAPTSTLSPLRCVRSAAACPVKTRPQVLCLSPSSSCRWLLKISRSRSPESTWSWRGRRWWRTTGSSSSTR